MNTDDQPHDRLEARFENYRDHLRGVAHRMLGSFADADDAVQLAWIRAERADTSAIDNLGGWLTTIVARVCLDILRTRRSRRETSLNTVLENVPAHRRGTDPEDEAVMVESVGLALMVVLDTLTPAECVAFVLHDLFAVPFDEIATIVGRSPATTKKLASRARHRVRETTFRGEVDLARRSAIVHAFLAASRDGDLDTLLVLLAPEVVRRADRFAVPADVAPEVRGARAVAEETRVFAHHARAAAVALVNGSPGIVVAPLGEVRTVLCVTIEDERIVAIDVIADPHRLPDLALDPYPSSDSGQPGTAFGGT